LSKIWGASQSIPSSTTSGIYTLTFTVPIGCYWIYIRWNRSSVIHTATVEYSNMQLMYGEAVIDYKLARSDFLDLPVSAFGYAGVYDEITNGTKVKRWEQETLDASKGFGANSTMYDGYTVISSSTFTNQLNAVSGQYNICIKWNGVPLRYTGYWDKGADCFNQATNNNHGWFTVDQNDSGWDSAYWPSANEVKAYLNGWKVNGYSTTGLITDEETGLLADGDTYTFANAGKYRNISVQKSTDGTNYENAELWVDYKITNLNSTAVLTNISGSSLYFKISYDYGVTANSWIGLDGTAPAENTLSYVSTTTLRDQNPDTWWRPYVIIYQLAKPEIVQLDYSGELILHPGQNNIIITDVETPVAISIKGAKKYLEG